MPAAASAQAIGILPPSTAPESLIATALRGAPAAPAQQIPTPAATIAARMDAVAQHPELARAGSAFNREFIARMRCYQGETPAYFENARWPLALAEEVSQAGFPSVNELFVPSRTRLPSTQEWRFLEAYREGDDVVVHNTVATVFGWDSKLAVRDPNDNGKCASGRHTMHNPGALGCALPVSLARRSTYGSPFAQMRKLPWFTPVVVTYKGKSITVPLIDNGPSMPSRYDSAPAGIDLTPAACLALGASLADIRKNRVAFNVSFRLPGAGRLAALD